MEILHLDAWHNFESLLYKTNKELFEEEEEEGTCEQTCSSSQLEC